MRPSIGVALVAASAFATAVYAGVIYDYVGSDYTFAQPPYTTAMHLEFVIALDSAIPAGTTTSSVNKLPGFTIRVSDGVNDDYVPNLFPFFTLTINAAGNVTDWDILVSNTAFAKANAFGDDVGDTVTHTSAFTGTPGGWTVSQQGAPEPATLALLGLGLAGLATIRRRASW